MTNRLHRPPPLDQLLARPAMTILSATHGRQSLLGVARRWLETWRQQPTDAQVAFDVDAMERACARQLEAQAAMHLKPVFNATGTVLHTNLGRAVAPAEAVSAVAAVMRGASNLEFDLASGKRGDRDDHIEGLLKELTGAQAVTAVNNNAAAVLLVLSALAAGKQVIVSRGELVEIGGAFRIPDIMRRAGARLVEVGTTNRTHLRDYEEAITGNTALLMKVHASNYAIEGFTASVDAETLGRLARDRGVRLVEDLGSGSLVDLTRWGLPAEPTPQQSVAAGVNVVTFSGDKLMGGPQAGLIVGDQDLIARIKKHPLKRALRLDKMTIAALEATLQLYRDPDRLAQRLPTLRCLARPATEVDAVAQQLLAALQSLSRHRAWDVQLSAGPSQSQIGSGSLPAQRLASHAVRLTAPTGQKKQAGRFVASLAAAMRDVPMPVIGHIESDHWCLDLRCIEQADVPLIVQQFEAMLDNALGPR